MTLVAEGDSGLLDRKKNIYMYTFFSEGQIKKTNMKHQKWDKYVLY